MSADSASKPKPASGARVEEPPALLQPQPESPLSAAAGLLGAPLIDVAEPPPGVVGEPLVEEPPVPLGVPPAGLEVPAALLDVPAFPLGEPPVPFGLPAVPLGEPPLPPVPPGTTPLPTGGGVQVFFIAVVTGPLA